MPAQLLIRVSDSSGNSKEARLRFLGLFIKRETEILALAAFLLALGSSLFSLYSYLTGERVTMVAVDEVTIFENICAPGRPLQFAIPFVYVNKASKDYSGVVLRSGLRIDFQNGVRYEFLGGFKVERLHNKINDVSMVDCRALPNDELTALRRLTIKTTGSPTPLVVGGASAASQELMLAVVEKTCDWNIDCDAQEFPPSFEKFRTLHENRDSVKLTLFGNVDGEREVSFECIVKLSQKAKDQLKSGRWLNLPCGEA